MRYSEIFKEAKRLHDLGFAVHWLHARSKRPVESGWTTGPRKPWEYLAKTYSNGFNLGVRTGTPSRIGDGYLAVVDIDVKSTDPRHEKEARQAVAALIPGGIVVPRVSSGRGNGSGHLYCVTSQTFKTWNPAASEEKVEVHMPSKKPSKKELELLSAKKIEEGIRLAPAWEISLYSEGRQVVLPPSVHPDSGKLYEWEVEVLAVSDLPVLSFGAETAEVSPGGVGQAGEGPALRGGAWDAQEPVREAHKGDERSEETALRFTVSPVDLAWLPISDDIRRGIIDGDGVTDRSGYLLKASTALLSAGLSQNEVLTVLTDPNTFLGACGYDHAKTKNRARAAAWVYRYTLKKVEAERSVEHIFTAASQMPKAPALSEEEQEAWAEELLGDRQWWQDLDRNKEGRTKVTLKNLDMILTHGVEGPVFIEDLFASRIEYGADMPWGGKAKSYIKDIDLILIKRWLADTQFGIEPSTSAVLEATSLLAHRCRIHPVRDYLEGLKWDGVSRVNTWIKDFCQGRALEPYLSEISRKFLLAMVKRVFEPGCQWDYVLVLEGKQGKYKSSIARALASDRWFMDNLPDLKDKDSMLNLQGKWLIELGELADVKRADYNLVKAYLVRRTDTVRPHYGRLQSDVPRQSVFIGTINEGQYLKDPTGNRRYWPVSVGLCDVNALTAVRDQLFAEAMHIYRTTNEILMLGERANIQATRAQEERRVDDDETEMRESLIDFIQSEASGDFDFKKFRTRDLMIGPAAPWARWEGKGYVMNTAAQVLTNLGFDRRKIRGQRYWKPPENLFKKLRGVSENEDAPGLPPPHQNFDFR